MNCHQQYISYGPSFQCALVEERNICLSSACAALAGRTLLFLSDIHASDSMFPERAVGRLIDQVASLRPDMILLGGDYAESRDWALRFFDLLSAVRPSLGAYAVLGNNDLERFPDSLHPLYDRMRNAGVTPLNGKAVRIHMQEAQIVIAGLPEFKHNPLPCRSLFSGKDSDALRILLAHYPHSIACHLNCPGIQPHLSLAGHTHGGQFRLGELTPYSIGFERNLKGVPLPAVSGWSPIGEGELLVSPGIGTSRLPVRMGVPPTMHLLRLTK